MCGSSKDMMMRNDSTGQATTTMSSEKLKAKTGNSSSDDERFLHISPCSSLASDVSLTSSYTCTKRSPNTSCGSRLRLLRRSTLDLQDFDSDGANMSSRSDLTSKEIAKLAIPSSLGRSSASSTTPTTTTTTIIDKQLSSMSLKDIEGILSDDGFFVHLFSLLRAIIHVEGMIYLFLGAIQDMIERMYSDIMSFIFSINPFTYHPDGAIPNINNTKHKRSSTEQQHGINNTTPRDNSLASGSITFIDEDDTTLSIAKVTPIPVSNKDEWGHFADFLDELSDETVLESSPWVTSNNGGGRSLSTLQEDINEEDDEEEEENFF